MARHLLISAGLVVWSSDDDLHALHAIEHRMVLLQFDIRGRVSDPMPSHPMTLV